MEIRISRILSEYYDYTRKESEDYIRQGRVSVNGSIATIGDKAGIDDEVALDGVKVPLKGIFKKVQREQIGKHNSISFGSYADDKNYQEEEQSPKSRMLRKGRKNEFARKRGGKNDNNY